MKILEALLDLNKQLTMEGFSSDFAISFCSEDFDRFHTLFAVKYKHMLFYPEIKPGGTHPRINEIKIAGAGSYFIIARRSDREARS